MDRAGREPHVPVAAGKPDVPAQVDRSAGLDLEVTSRAGSGAPDQAAGPADPGAEPAAGAAARTPPAAAAGGGRPSWLGLALPRPVWHLILLVCYLGAGVVVTWPRATYLTGSLPESRDSAAYVWGFWWMARQVRQLGDPWFTSHMAAPGGVALGFHTLMPLPGLLLTPVTWVFGPSASYNLLVILMPGLLCYAMYRAARLWLRSQAGAIAAGAFFGLSSMLTQQDWYHLNIVAGALFLPIALEAAVRLRRSPGWRQAVILGVVMGASVLTDTEISVLAAIMIALVLLPWLLWRPAVARLWPAALAVLAGAVVAIPQLLAMAHEQAADGLGITPQLMGVTDNLYGIGLPGMFSATPRVADFGLAGLAAPWLHGKDNEGMPMFGITLTVLALFGLAAAWRRRHTWKLAALWIGCAALALGTSLWIGRHQFTPLMQIWHGVPVSAIMPFTWFTRIPGLSSFREADRLAILGMVPACLLAGAAVDWMRYHARPLIALVVACGVLECGYTGNPRIGQMPTTLHKLDAPIAASHSSAIVVDVPFGLRGGIPVYGGMFTPEALVLATADDHPRAIGYVARLPHSTISATSKHAFYFYLIHTEHYSRPRPVTPLTRPEPRALPLWAARPPSYLPLTPAEVTAASRDVSQLNVGWVLLWHSNVAERQLLRETGFGFSYRADGVSVYRPVRN